MQLDLFADAPRHYHLAIEKLLPLDLAGCESALDRHRRSFPHGPDPRPVEEAARWLSAHLPPAGADPGVYGALALAACRALLEGRAAPAFPRVGSGAAARVARSLANRCVARMALARVPDSAPVDGALPWAVFHLWAGDARRAKPGLQAFARDRQGPAAVYLALGDALAQTGRDHDALRAYREGYALDPEGDGWAPQFPQLVKIREALAAESIYPGAWWAVGAYLEGRFPRYREASPDEVGRRRERFRRLVAERGSCPSGASASDPPLFFLGLFLSEHASRLGPRDLALVRQTLRELNPEAFEIHMEQIGGGSNPGPSLRSSR